MVEETGPFLMDSGAFLDVIPLVLNYLDLKSLIQLSQTCHFWRQRIYNDMKLWANMIELPYIGQMEGGEDGRNDPKSVVEAKLWSMIPPPEDPKALEKVLGKMASSEESIQRFQLVEKVQFKNYLHTDESLRLTALLFPSIRQISFEGKLLTIVGVGHIARSCQKLNHIEFYQCGNLNMPSDFQLFNTEEHQMNLERIFFHDNAYPRHARLRSIEDYLPFMALCQRCGLYFNQLKNEKQMLCLHHPGKYDGYGHSCSSYSCCGSNTPKYPSTLGCQYTHHIKCLKPSESSMSRSFELHNGHPEYMFEKYDYEMFSFQFTERRRLDHCYRKWNMESKSYE